MNFTFSRDKRLLTSRDYKCVFAKAKRYYKSSILLLTRPNNKSHARVGIIIAKKNIAKAHDRQRIKRLIRETFRLEQNELPAVDIIFLIKKPCVTQTNQQLTTNLRELFCELSKSHKSV